MFYDAGTGRRRKTKMIMEKKNKWDKKAAEKQCHSEEKREKKQKYKDQRRKNNGQ